MQVNLKAVATSLFTPWQRCNWRISQPVTYNYIFSLLMFQFRLVQNKLQTKYGGLIILFVVFSSNKQLLTWIMYLIRQQNAFRRCNKDIIYEKMYGMESFRIVGAQRA